MGSRKYLLASLDQSLRRMGLDYVDIFYSHRVDPDTPLDETMGALVTAVEQGKALYAGISSYSSARTVEAAKLLADHGVPLLIHQPSYSMLNRWIEHDQLLDTLEEVGAGCIAFSPLAQGMLTDRYLDGIPADSRVATGGALSRDMLTEERLAHVRALAAVADARGQSLAQLALGVGAARPADDLARHRREQRRPARRQPGRARQPRLRRRRADGHRPGRHRRRHQPVGRVQRSMSAGRSGRS